MPEAPELHLAARYINTVCEGLIFSGPVEKSEVSKNPEVPFKSPGYTISAISRGKEVKLSLTPIKVEESHKVKGQSQKHGGSGRENSPMDIVFRFGMSGCFTLTPVDEMPKHAHLRFYTDEKPRRVLCFVDVRRFGSWVAPGIWQSNRGPCVMLEYEKFRENVIKNLQDKAFDKPICEALLNQKYFNGIGNYLRAEILFRLKIPPFVKARTVLEPLEYIDEISLSEKLKLKKENPDLLDLCNLLPFEVVNLEEKGSDSKLSDNYAGLQKWVQCYYVPGMKTLLDSNKRAIWFQGDPGPMAPKGATINRKRVFLVKTDPDATSVKETISKRKKAGVTSNKGPLRKNTRTRESAKKLPSSATRKRGSSLQDPNTPQSRGRGQQPRREAKTSAVKYSPRNTPVVKGIRGQKLSKKGDHSLKISVNSQKKGSTQKVKNEEQPAPFAKTPLTKSQDERVRKGKKEVLSPPPGGSLKNTLLAEGRNSRLGAQKIAGSRSGTARNPRRVKAK